MSTLGGDLDAAFASRDAAIAALAARVAALETPEPGPDPTPEPEPEPQPTTGHWLSGASGALVGTGQFGTWRGNPAAIASTWINTADMWTLRPGYEYGNWTGAIDVGASTPPDLWKGFPAEAAGQNDAFWHAYGKALAQYRTGKGTTYVRLWYEFNGDWMTFSAKPGEEASVRAAYKRVAAILRQEFPAVKISYGTCTSAPTSTRVSISACWPEPGVVDVLSIDHYNNWPYASTKAQFDAKISTSQGAHSLEPLRKLAEQKGVPVIISEWGNCSNPSQQGGGGDAPVWVQCMYDWFKANAGTGPGQVLGEVYFNITDAAYQDYFYLVNDAGQVNPRMPQAVAKYRELFKTT